MLALLTRALQRLHSYTVALLRAERAVVRGWSMYPTLLPGEYVLFDRIAYRRESPRRGDVVLARHPSRPGLRVVKRVAAVPGDEVAGEGEQCWVNGEPVYEGLEGDIPASPRILGPDEYLVLGDSPHLSTDAREFGPVRRSDIIGRAWLVYWPLRRARPLAGEWPPPRP